MQYIYSPFTLFLRVYKYSLSVSLYRINRQSSLSGIQVWKGGTEFLHRYGSDHQLPTTGCRVMTLKSRSLGFSSMECPIHLVRGRVIPALACVGICCSAEKRKTSTLLVDSLLPAAGDRREAFRTDEWALRESEICIHLSSDVDCRRGSKLNESFISFKRGLLRLYMLLCYTYTHGYSVIL
jgi:hypothetical protein